MSGIQKFTEMNIIRKVCKYADIFAGGYFLAFSTPIIETWTHPSDMSRTCPHRSVAAHGHKG